MSKKTGMYDVVLLVCYIHAEFQLGISFFDKVMTTKILKIDDVKHSKSFFVCHCRPHTTKLRPPLGSP